MADKMVVMTFHDVTPERLEGIHKLFLSLVEETSRSANFNVIDMTEDPHLIHLPIEFLGNFVGEATIDLTGEINMSIDPTVGQTIRLDQVKHLELIPLSYDRGVRSDGK